MKNNCVKYIVFRPLCLPAVASFSNCLYFEISSQESSKTSRYLVPLEKSLKIYSLDKFKVFCLHLTIKRLIILIKVEIFVQCAGGEVPVFNHSKKRSNFSDPLGPTREIKICYLLDIASFIALEKVKCNRLCLIRKLLKWSFVLMLWIKIFERLQILKIKP